MINSPMGPGNEIIVPGELECSCNMFSYIWSVGRHICPCVTFEVTVIVTVKVILVLGLIIPWELGMK